MSSSFPKHFCFHRFVSFFSALLIIGSLVAIIKKDCRVIPLQSDNKLWPSIATNQSLMENFITHYYDTVQIYHIVIISADVVIFLLAFINIAPAQEDLRFGFHLLVIIILGGITILTSYTSYIAFQMPCHRQIDIAGKVSTTKMAYHHNSKDKTPVNSYTEEDMFMLAVTVMDAFAGLLFLIGTIILCLDAREEAIQDEYVARVRTSIY